MSYLIMYGLASLGALVAFVIGWHVNSRRSYRRGWRNGSDYFAFNLRNQLIVERKRLLCRTFVDHVALRHVERMIEILNEHTEDGW